MKMSAFLSYFFFVLLSPVQDFSAFLFFFFFKPSQLRAMSWLQLTRDGANVIRNEIQVPIWTRQAKKREGGLGKIARKMGKDWVPRRN